jgi:N-acetylglutamate synthase-like GNAT family acetyltransferase
VGLRFIEDGVFELTKMAVDKTYHGGGAGKFLCQSGIDKAREMGIKKLILFSSRRLEKTPSIFITNWALLKFR